MKYIYKTITYLIVIFSLSACDSELDKENPNSLVVSSYFANTDELTRAVNATYATLQDPQLVSREWFFVNDLRSDDMATGGGQLETPRAQLLNGTNDPANFVAQSFWTGAYGLIHRANGVIEYAPKAVTTGDDDVALRDRLVGEAKFLRAWAYFELVSMWGGVPLYEQTVITVNDYKGRATKDEVYASVISNLNDAIAVLPASYTGSDLGRATKGAARALLARVFMQRGNYADAKTQLDSIIKSDLYHLVDRYTDNFTEENEYNAESIFEVGFIDQNGNYGWGYNQGIGLGNETTVHNQEISPITWGNLIPALKLLEDFETGDPRYKYSFYEVGDTIASGPLTEKSFNIASTTIGGITKKVGWRKHTIIYKNVQSYYPSGINERVMRYAEILLNMAECVNETDGTETEVLGYLNQIRTRLSVNMPPYPTSMYPTSTKDERFTAIVHEKRIEMAAEEIRNKDILRWREQGKLSLIGGEPIKYFEANKYELLPIPQQTIDNNPLIGSANQNPGY
jgi:starch-binding outer membrane protein, SusD/RagB family